MSGYRRHPVREESEDDGPVDIVDVVPSGVDCPHGKTKPAQWDRWRICNDCGILVHRWETKHFQDLRADGNKFWIGQHDG